MSISPLGPGGEFVNVNFLFLCDTSLLLPPLSVGSLACVCCSVCLTLLLGQNPSIKLFELIHDLLSLTRQGKRDDGGQNWSPVVFSEGGGQQRPWSWFLQGQLWRWLPVFSSTSPGTSHSQWRLASAWGFERWPHTRASISSLRENFKGKHKNFHNKKLTEGANKRHQFNSYFWIVVCWIGNSYRKGLC